MAADIYPLNGYFGNIFGKESDISPYPYKLYYVNMNIGSTYFMGLLIIIVMVCLTYLLSKKWPIFQNYLNFLYNFFCFGLYFSAFTSLQGSLINSTQIIELNGLFYILGIALYILSVFGVVYWSIHSFQHNVNRIRILTKASLLGLCHLSPIVLLLVVIIVDCALMFC